ncbi:MAG TPA: DUF4412 domain-containing protein [Thermoanaerobaculia bacterium]|nr:DUF4412 domain-containing protein [Thermoanaerobaculia bacterium]
MPRSSLVALVVGIVLAAAPPARAQFEGMAEMKITTNTGKGGSIPASGRVFVTKTAYRMEWEMDLSRFSRGKNAGASAAPQHVKTVLFGKLADPDHLTMLDDAHKTYSVWDLKKTRSEGGELPKQTYTVQKLGSDTVAGFSCQKAQLTSSNGNVIDVCVSKDFAGSSDWLAVLGRRQKEGSGWAAALRENGLAGFPLRFAMRTKAEAEPFVTMQVTKIERGPQPDALFEVPAGYKQTEFALGGLSPEQQKAVSDARARMREVLDKMTPEQRKAYEDAMKRAGVPTPVPTPAP